MADSIERRASRVEVRADGRRIVGLAVPWGHTETCEAARCGQREAFEPYSVLAPTVGLRITADHDDGKVLAEGRAAVSPRDTAKGGEVRATLPEGELQDRVLADVRAGKRGFSIEFRATEQRIRDGVRSIVAAVVETVSLVTSPAYRTATAEVRSRQDARRELLPWV